MKRDQTTHPHALIQVQPHCTYTGSKRWKTSIKSQVLYQCQKSVFGTGDWCLKPGRLIHKLQNRLQQPFLKIALLIITTFCFNNAKAGFNVTAISVSTPQTGTVTYGTAGSVTYTITFGMTDGSDTATNLSLNWTPPTGVVSSPTSTTLTGNLQELTLTLSTTTLTPAGTYSFTVTSSNQTTTVTSAAASFVVDPMPITITANPDSKTYGTALVNVAGSTAFASTPTSLPNGDVLGTVSLAYGTGAAANDPVMNYVGSIMPSTATGGSFVLSNYLITYLPGTLTINPAPLTISANNVSKVYGTALSGGPGSTAITTSGLQNLETIGSVTIAYGSGSASGAAVGTYPSAVTPSLVTANGTFDPANYQISYFQGSITVTISSTTTSVTTSLTPSCVSSSITLSATVSSVLSNATGSVEFFDGAVSLGIVTLASNQAALTLTTLPVGARSITAKYLGDANNAGSTSPSITQTVNANPSSSMAGANQTGSATCGLTTVTLNANMPTVGTGAWSIASGTGGSFANGTSPTSGFTGISGNAYTLRWTISNGPCLASQSDVLITLNAVPVVTQPADQILCSNSPTTAIVFSGGTSYTWANDKPSIGLGASGNGNIPAFTAANSGTANVTATISVTPSANGCTGTAKTFTIIVKPLPVVTATPSTQTICSNSNIATITLTSNIGGTISWTRDNLAGITGSGGLTGFSGTGDINGSLASTLAAPSNLGLHATALFGGCISAAPTDFSVTVNPVATVNAISDQTICNASFTTAVNFSSAITTNFTWTNSNTNIGLAASGTQNNIASFPGTNSGTAPISGTITVTPVYTNAIGCNGTPRNFSITVNPIPVLRSTATPAAICSGSPFDYNPSTDAGVVNPSFSWTRAAVNGISNTASSGSGNISETLINTTTLAVNVTYVYSVSGSNNSINCTNSATYNVVVPVKPTPDVKSSPASQAICTGESIVAITLSNPNNIPGTTFSWLRSNVNNIPGIATSGTNTTITGTLTNITSGSTSTIFTSLAISNGCSSSKSSTVTVNPLITSNTIMASQVSEVSLCGLTKQVTFVTRTPKGGSGSFSYQWQVSVGDPYSFIDILNATDTVLVQKVSSDSYFRRIVFSGGCADSSAPYSILGAGGGRSQVVDSCTGNQGVDIYVIASFIGANYTLWRDKKDGNGFNPVGSSIPGNGAKLLFSNNAGLGDYKVVATIGNSCSQEIPDSAGNLPGVITIAAGRVPDPPNTDKTGLPICSGGSFNLTGTVAGTSGALYWYKQKSGGTPLNNGSPVASGANFDVTPYLPVISNDTVVVYWAKAIFLNTGCKSSNRDSVVVRINKTPKMTSDSLRAICSGSAVNLVFSNNLSPSGTYTWIAASNLNIGGESTSSQVTSTLNDVLTNTTAFSDTVRYTVVPKIPVTYGSGFCSGLAQNIKVAVDPVPFITPQTATICSGNSFTINPANGGGNTVPTSPVTQYTWPAPAGSGFTGGVAGSGTSISGTLTNTTNTPVQAVYTVTPSGGACSGSSFTATVTINPKPFIATQNVTVCNNVFSLPPFSGGANIIPVGTTYTWPAPTGTNISGLAAGSNSPVISGSLVNTSSPSVSKTATYTVTPTGSSALGGCIGNNFTVFATINPIPSATISGATTVCQNSGSPNVTFTGSGGTAPYTFTYNINGGSTLSTGTGSPSAIVPVSTLTPGTYNYKILSVSDNLSTCQIPISGNVDVIILPKPVIPAQSLRSCSGANFSFAAVNASPTAATVVPAGTTYTWSTPALPSGVTGASGGINQSGLSQTLINNSGSSQIVNYTLTPSAGGCAGAAIPLAVSIDPAVAANTAIWTGSLDNSWCNPLNWACGIIPGSGTNVTVPASVTNKPIIQDYPAANSPCVAFANNIDVQGTATLTINANNSLNLYGDFTNKTASQYTMNGEVNFAGVNQFIPGFAYNKVSVNGGGNKTVSGNATVAGQLALTNGIVNVMGTNSFTVGVSGSITQATSASYILGPLTRLTASQATFDFPVGGILSGANSIRPATITTTDNTPGSFTVFYHPSNPGGTLLGTNAGGMLTNEYWEITQNSGGDATAAMFYKLPNAQPAATSSGDWTSNFNPCQTCNVAVVENFGSFWDFSGGSSYTGGFASGPPSEYAFWQTQQYISSRVKLKKPGPNFYSFGYSFSQILPVTLLNFTGTLQGASAMLQWTFAAGSDLASIELQHGTDGRNFSKLATIAALANVTAYSYPHLNLPSGAHYYRLLISDKTGKKSYSNTVLLVVGKQITVITGIRPTMVRNETFIDIRSAGAQKVRAMLFDVTGRKVAAYSGYLQQGINSYRIPTNMLAQGLYTIQVKTADGVLANLRFVKE